MMTPFEALQSAQAAHAQQLSALRKDIQGIHNWINERPPGAHDHTVLQTVLAELSLPRDTLVIPRPNSGLDARTLREKARNRRTAARAMRRRYWSASRISRVVEPPCEEKTVRRWLA